MPRHHPVDVLRDFDNTMMRAQGLASAAQKWIVRTDGPRNPRFTVAYRDMLIELAFLHTFLAWERFLEESFLLYMLGKESPQKYAPKCFVKPPTRAHAFRLTLPERGRTYADWDNAEVVRERAVRFFARGDPYENVLGGHTYALKEIQIIRNAIVHRSITSQDRFRELARNKIGYLPPKLSVGAFLNMAVRGLAIPLSNLDNYLNKLGTAARNIIP